MPVHRAAGALFFNRLGGVAFLPAAPRRWKRPRVMGTRMTHMSCHPGHVSPCGSGSAAASRDRTKPRVNSETVIDRLMNRAGYRAESGWSAAGALYQHAPGAHPAVRRRSAV